MIDPIVIPEPPEPSKTSSTFNGVRLNTRFAPATDAAARSGWCESFIVSADVIALSIGSICDQGAERFAAMIATRRAIRDAAYAGSDPASTLAAANRILRQHDSQESATALFALLNTSERSLRFANAGHQPPLMAGALGTLFLEFPDAQIPLGIEDEISPALHVVSAPPNTMFVLYSDDRIGSRQGGSLEKARLRDAAAFAYKFSTVPTPDVAAILTAWTPHVPVIRNARGRARGPSALRL